MIGEKANIPSPWNVKSCASDVSIGGPIAPRPSGGDMGVLSTQRECGCHMGALVVEFLLAFPSHNIRIILSRKGSNLLFTRRPTKRYDRTLNLAERCLPPICGHSTPPSHVPLSPSPFSE